MTEDIQGLGEHILMVGNLTYRLAEEKDLPGLLRLWEEESGWGQLTPEIWRQWYVDTPHGACLVMVAVDEDGEIAGQEIFTPSRAVAGEREISALRLSAPILRKDLRRVSVRNVNHPVIELYKAGMQAAAEQGYSIVYALPEHAWLPIFRWVPPPLPRFADVEYECLALPLAPFSINDAAGKANELIARQVTDFTAEYDALWQSARETFPIHCGVVRHPARLRYRNGSHAVLEARDASGALIGYTSTKLRSGLLFDILARTPAELPAVLGATLRWLVTEAPDALKASGIDSLRAMETPALSPALRELGFTPVDYKFAFVCDTIDASLAAEETSPARWYITPGD